MSQTTAPAVPGWGYPRDESRERARRDRPLNVNKSLLLLRVVVGALFVGHGAQKLFGWFGGRR